MANVDTIGYVIRNNGVALERGRLSARESNTLAMSASAGIWGIVNRCPEGAVIHLRHVTPIGDGRIVGVRQRITVSGCDGWICDPVTHERIEYRRTKSYSHGRNEYRGFPASAWPQG